MYLLYNNISKVFRFLWIAVWFISGSLNIYAQDIISGHAGMVVDQFGVPVPNVEIGVKNKEFATQTDQDGVFRFYFVQGDVLTFSHHDYLYHEVKLKKEPRGTLTIRLAEKTVKNYEKLDVVYNTVSKESYLGAASTIYTDQITSSTGTNIVSSFAGQLSGLSSIQYRGMKQNIVDASTERDIFIGNRPFWLASAYSDNTQFSLNARGHSPVVIVDGVQRELFSIDPEAIESVSIQKDALSSMMLGMRSSKGVLVITTKKPIDEGFQISFTGKAGIQQPVNMPNPVSAYQRAYLLNEALTNDGKAASYTHDDYIKFRDGSSPYTHPNVNWYDQALKSNSSIQSYNLNASGGNKVAQFFVSLGYIREDGLFQEMSSNKYNTNQRYERYLITSKVNVNVTRDLKAEVTIMGRIEDGNQPGAGSGAILNDIYRTPNSAYPVHNPDELYKYGGSVSFPNNLVSMTNNSGYISDNTRDGVGVVTLNYNMDWLLKGLSAKAMGNVSTQSRSALNRSKRSPVYQYNPPKTDGAESSYDFYGSREEMRNDFVSVYTFQHMYGQFSVDYKTEIGKHTIGGGALADMQQVLLNYNLPRRTANINPWANYNYDGKYFAEAMLSRSYFNQYRPGIQWGTFFAFGMGWDISREEFMTDVDWINLLKLRGVYGLTGNGIDNAGYFIWRQVYAHEDYNGYDLGYNATPNGRAYENNGMLANPNISWEKAHKTNIGLDVSVLNNCLQFSVDYYIDKYFNLLQTRGKNIALVGLSYAPENIGKQNRSGVELELTYQNHAGKFNYFVTGNWSVHNSKVIFMDEQFVKEEYNKVTGNPAGAWFGLVADGFFSSQEEIDASPTLQNYTVLPGDIRYKDLNDDGVIDIYDHTIIGNDKPLNIFGLNMGFEYNGFDFSILFQGARNRDIYLGDAGKDFTVGFQNVSQGYAQIYEHMLDRWTPETASTASYPRLSAGGNTYNADPNYWRTSFWVRSGNYIRLKNISVGYTLPESVSRNYLGGVRVKFFVNGQNLLTQSACNMVDPEVIDFRNYPLLKAVNAGINIRF